MLFNRHATKNRQLARRHSPIHVIRKNQHVPMVLYDTALSEAMYGNVALGDFFGDVMGAVIGKEKWDARPDWMKKIKFKTDPKKILQRATSIVSPQRVEKVVNAADQAGLNLFYRTPMGDQQVTGGMARGLYEGYPTFAAAKGALESVPVWGWAVGAGGIILLFYAMKK